MKELSQEQKDLIAKPLPSEAVTQHPTKTYLSSIKAIYVTERLNEVFGFWGWTIKVKKEEHGEKWMIVVHVTFEVPEYWFYYECFWWNDNGGETSKNFDLWDAYKWATTDAITKIASWIGIWAEVFKGKQKWGNKTQEKTTESPTGEKTQKELIEFIEEIRLEKDVNHIKTLVNQAWKIYKTEKQIAWITREARERTDKLDKINEYQPWNELADVF